MEDDVMVDMKTMIRDSGDGHVSPDCCISRVIYPIRDIKPDAYTPKIVSIGPFHYGDERLQDMERHKQVFFKRFTQRSHTNLDVMINFVKSSVPKVRASYSGNINLSDKELVKLILLDAAFIIEYIFTVLAGQKKVLKDAKLSQPSLMGILFLDLVLFENQLPFFVLEELFNIAFPLNLRDGRITFPKLACQLLSSTFGFEGPEHDLNNNVRAKHFTDLLRFLFFQGALPRVEPFFRTTDILSYSAKELQEFGVKFKASKSKSLLDIKFSGHVLELPRIYMEDLVTEALFLNMTAFEQIHCPLTPYIASCVTLWSCLISTREDVDILVRNNIIRNFMADTEAVAAFSIMAKNCYQACFIVSEHVDIFRRLNKFCGNGLRRTRRDYCRTALHTVASFSGITLILTILQTIFSILQAIKEKDT
ncbi:UPF0481 protein At3g47200-like [Neltuma alba]|uniref:UPF0481 protein At3g47200-like n=1 Tax=Neltuma alba TaxID=207710 RepID=UPI0010A47BC3|nr:UPF0481 protein At3g47200-like [Prosopis alba]